GCANWRIDFAGGHKYSHLIAAHPPIRHFIDVYTAGKVPIHYSELNGVVPHNRPTTAARAASF
ncbi:MAG: hypothetical protein KJ921_10575, partial [Proteobacteria bacterium]|nr:hypothetical protein [Pseudomonadota bacterium]